MTANNSKNILIEAASRLFRIRGYDGVGINDIIKESGIPKGSLYHYFPKGKEDLAIEAIHHTKKIVITEIQEVFEKYEDPIKAFQAHIYQLSEDILQDDHYIGLPIGTIAGEKHSTSEPIRMTCQLAFEHFQLIYKNKLLEAGYSERQSKDLSIVINALLEGGIILSETLKSENPLQVIAEQIPAVLRKK
ncbi:TetR/AcrR family transcriptional regulator [Sporosarcina cascadiensis]|uniref:TetR/AcrR family transcriptional regulator n=1 Tax=Sporosarcina cascadiensis TaxID=2660747 RepID=UPI00129B4CF5|nr:TetR/AcrR family transcriptional regulator [Sporosarcina cascadiensis]